LYQIFFRPMAVTAATLETAQAQVKADLAELVEAVAG
jgi:hypothetical protein